MSTPNLQCLSSNIPGSMLVSYQYRLLQTTSPRPHSYQVKITIKPKLQAFSFFLLHAVVDQPVSYKTAVGHSSLLYCLVWLLPNLIIFLCSSLQRLVSLGEGLFFELMESIHLCSWNRFQMGTSHIHIGSLCILFLQREVAHLTWHWFAFGWPLHAWRRDLEKNRLTSVQVNTVCFSIDVWITYFTAYKN